MKFKFQNYYLYLLLIVVLIGSILRITFLVTNPSFWGDETAVWNISKLPIFKILTGDYWDFPSHPFLFYLVIKLWSIFSIDERWLRLPSLLASTFSIFGIYMLSNEIFKNKKTSLISSFLFAFSTYNIKFSTETKFYSLEFFLEILSFVFFIKFINNFKKQKSSRSIYLQVLFILFSFLAVSTDYSFFWLYLVYVLFSLILCLQKLIKDHTFHFKKILQLFITLGSIPILFFPWLTKIIFRFNESLSMRGYLKVPTINDFIETFLAFPVFFKHKYTLPVPERGWWDSLQNYFGVSHNFAEFIYYFLNYLFFLILVLLLIQLLRNIIKSLSNILLLGIIMLPITISFVVSQKYPIFVHYNLMIAQIGILFILASYITNHPKAGIAVTTLYIFLNLLGLNVLFKFRTNQDWRGVHKYLQAQKLGKDEVVIISPGFYSTPLDYYNGKNKINPYYVTLKINNSNKYLDLNSYTLLTSKNYSHICFIQNTPSPAHKSKLTKIVLNYLYTHFYSESQKEFESGIFVDCFGKKPS